MEEKSNKPNTPNTEGKPRKKPYYKKRYAPQPIKRKFWNADKVVSLSAMAIALFTLVVLLYQSHILDKQYDLTVKQQKASVLPYLIFGDAFDDISYKIILQNKGLGPAFIKGMYIKEKDSIFLIENLFEYYLQNNTDTVRSWSSSGLVDGVVLAPGDKIELFSAGGGSSGLDPIINFFHSKFYGNSSNSFIIEYESVFEDAWIVESSLQTFTKEEYGEFEVFYDKIE